MLEGRRPPAVQLALLVAPPRPIILRGSLRSRPRMTEATKTGFSMDALTQPQRKTPSAARRPPYPDLHDHIRALDDAGLLIRVDRPINKDTEMHPLVRWQFRGGIAERDRKAFLFTNVVDAKGRKYDILVVVGGLAANKEIYRIGIGCP